MPQLSSEDFTSPLLSNNVKGTKICKNVILPAVLHGCETCPLTLREEDRDVIWEDVAENNIETEK